jgi:DNA-binding CsgD family transcriptional regulator
MDKKITAFLEQLALADTIEGLHHLVLYSASLFDVDHAIYHSVSANAKPFALASYGAEWANYYESGRLFLVDPVVLNSFHKFEAYEWKSLDWSSKNARKLMLDASDGGVGNQGISFPIRGPHGEQALYSLNTNTSDEKWERFLKHQRNNLLLVAYYLHESARKILAQAHDHHYIALSPREVDSLTLLGLGHNRARVAETLSISEHTLRVYIESSRIKLGANNTTHAVAKAMTQGLISI